MILTVFFSDLSSDPFGDPHDILVSTVLGDIASFLNARMTDSALDSTPSKALTPLTRLCPVIVPLFISDIIPDIFALFRTLFISL